MSEGRNCKIAPNTNDFYYLKVPSKLLHHHLHELHRIGENIDIYWQIQKGKLNFSGFLIRAFGDLS